MITSGVPRLCAGAVVLSRPASFTRSARSGARALWCAALLAAAVCLPSRGEAQYSYTVRLTAADINRGSGAACNVTTKPLTEPEGKQVEDTVTVVVYDSTLAALAKTQTELVVRLGTSDLFRVPAGQDSLSKAAGVRGLSDREVAVGRADAPTKSLCRATPVPRLATAHNLAVRRTEFIASGEVSSALRSGAESGQATGTLGIHHRSPALPGTRSSLMPLGFLPDWPGVEWVKRRLSYRNDYEELRAVISVAGTADTLFSASSTQPYAQSVLSPLTAAHGNLSSFQLEYIPQHAYGSDGLQLRGFHLLAGGSHSLWRVDSVPVAVAGSTAYQTQTKDVTLLSLDLRYRWTFVNHPSDSLGNLFSFAVDGGWDSRWIAGDASFDENVGFRQRALRTSRTYFSGPALAAYITLRQVVAFADIEHLGGIRHRKRGKVESLEGWQPLIGFRFEAPFFSL